METTQKERRTESVREKAQLANYRCEAAAKEVKTDLEKRLESVRGRIVNYWGAIEGMNV